MGPGVDTDMSTSTSDRLELFHTASQSTSLPNLFPPLPSTLDSLVRNITSNHKVRRLAHRPHPGHIIPQRVRPARHTIIKRKADTPRWRRVEIFGVPAFVREGADGWV